MQGMAIAQFAAAASKQYLSSYAARAQQGAQSRIEHAEAAATNRVRAANNLFEANQASLARFMQSTNNNRALDAMGEALEANLVNVRRQDDAYSRASFEDSVRAAEAEGGAAAAQAWSGLSSSVVDQVNSATALRRARANADAENNRKFMNFDAGRRASQIVSQSIRGLDSDVIMTSLDYNTNIAREYGKINPYVDALRAGVSAVLGQGENFGSERVSGGGGEPMQFSTQGGVSAFRRQGTPFTFNARFGEDNAGPRLGQNATTDTFWGNVRFGDNTAPSPSGDSFWGSSFSLGGSN